MHRTPVGSTLIAFAAGGVVGAVVALMLAPAAGPETRRRLREASARTVDRARVAMDGARRAAAEQAHRLGQALEEGRAAQARNAAQRESPWNESVAPEGVIPREPGAA